MLTHPRDNPNSLKRSTWSNIEVYNLPSLNIGLNYAPSRDRTQLSQTLVIENNQKAYDQGQDTGPISENLAVISDDGTSITFNGNMWRALPLTDPMSAADLGDFVVSFDYVVEEQNEVSMVCFEDNLEWGSAKNPTANTYDPARCLLLNLFQTSAVTSPYIRAYQPKVGEPHHYAYNLSKLFDRFYELKYFAVVSDNDIGDKSGGIVTISNIKITTTLTSCLKDVGFAFQLGDCTTDKFLVAIEERMDTVNCPGEHDPLLEMMALWDVVNEMEVYKKIEVRARNCVSIFSQIFFIFFAELKRLFVPYSTSASLPTNLPSTISPRRFRVRPNSSGSSLTAAPY